MSAAIEGAIEGLPSIGFSLCDYSLEADFSHTREYVKKIAQHVLQHGIPEGIALNVNFPSKAAGTIKGIKICRQANASWQEEFDMRKDPTGRRYFWMTGSFVNHDKGEDTDEWALAQNYVSIVPCMYDLTAYRALTVLNSWDL
jgi:5'-nucleotidase